MFTVTTVNLTSDTTGADSSIGAAELGPLSAAEFTALLGRFQQLEARQNHDADPHILVTASAGRFLIRTGQGKLLLYNARDTTEPYSELSASEIAVQLDRPLTAPLPTATEPGATAPRPAPHYAIAFAILIAGLGLNAYTLYSAKRTARKGSENGATAAAKVAADKKAKMAGAAGSIPGGRPAGPNAPRPHVSAVELEMREHFRQEGGRLRALP